MGKTKNKGKEIEKKIEKRIIQNQELEKEEVPKQKNIFKSNSSSQSSSNTSSSNTSSSNTSSSNTSSPQQSNTSSSSQSSSSSKQNISPYYIDFSIYGKNPPIEIQVLKDIRAQNFRIQLDNGNQLLSSDLSKYRITIKDEFIDFKFVKYENYSYFIPFDTKDYKSYKIKMYDLDNIPINIDKCNILLSSTNGIRKSYNFQNFIVNIDLLNKNSNIVYIPIVDKNGKVSMRKNEIIPNNKAISNNKNPKIILPKKSVEELKIEEFTKLESKKDLSGTNIKELIWY